MDRKITRDQRALLETLDRVGSLAASDTAFHSRTFRSLARRGLIRLARVAGYERLRWQRESSDASR